MKSLPNGFKTGLRITGKVIAVYLLLFVVLWADMGIFRTQYFQALPPAIQLIILLAYVPVTYPLDRIGILKP